MTESVWPGGVAPWWTTAVVYQIYPRSFADSNGDGVGDLGGIRQHLDHLADLGVDVIWLSPVYPSPQHDNGYDISDYQNIEPLFGTLDEFDALLAEVHERGMRLVMDLVVNHTSDEHPWFVESKSSPDNPKRDWYWWRDARGGHQPGEPGAEPTNWRSFFSGPSWQLDEATGQYYLHLFAVQQPDLNWENPDVRAAVYAMMNWWLDRGVDGFRMDVINFISKHLDLPEAPVAPGETLADGAPFFISGPRIHEFLHEMNEKVFAGRDAQFITVGEMPGVTIDDARQFTDPQSAEIDMVFQFEHVGLDHGPGGKFDPQPLDLVALKHSLARWQEGLGTVGWNSLYLDNHDQPRLVSRFGDDGEYRYESATLWATALHLHRGTPYIYQGEEIGMTNVPFESISDYRDVETLNHYLEATGERGASAESVMPGIRSSSRDNARTPVQWNDGPQAGFTTGEPWIGVNPNYLEVNAERDRASERSVFRFYQRLIELRHTSDLVALGTFELLEAAHPTLYAFTRTLGDEKLLVVANVSGEPLELWPLTDGAGTLLAPWAGDEPHLLIANLPASAAAPDAGTLAPWEARVYRL
ncbi:glycoside hydrolase family 13 protein [Subtercola vilae]|uniref:Alpha-glucosidase n=1 Tax=Subtercola vilae TaxID=2056433 RepID=A0A4T2BPI1_9MICO|nr:alpha-glucosidase [Subtercola vilae]TIH33327.1 alpha-glucosidase [Subtercola vilae]